MNIDDLTIGQAKELASIMSGNGAVSAQATPSAVLGGGRAVINARRAKGRKRLAV